MYRILVIGRGLIGSATARHLTKLTDGVALLGPIETTDPQSHSGVFGSHYDEGRMTRVVDPVPEWSITAKNSILRYGEIEAESGIPFFTEAGYLGIGPESGDYLKRSAAQGAENGADLTWLSASDMAQRFSFLAVPDAYEGLYEGRNAGYVSPRKLVAAQAEAARRAAADLIDAEATAVRPFAGGVEVETADGTLLQAERVVIATGAFTDICGLAPMDLHLRVFGRTVVLARINDDFADAFDGMPTMVHADSGAYILPPIRYPDGKSYLKIGIGSTDDPEFRDRSGLAGWFKSPGSDDNRRDFQTFLEGLFPPLAKCTAWHSDSCAVTWTKTGLPYIHALEEGRVTLAVGGNGKGAKSSDDWGWVAARVAIGNEEPHPVDRQLLQVPGVEASKPLKAV